MDVPTYWDGGSHESVCDPSRAAWGSYYSLGTAGHDFTFDFTASGTYRIYFYFMDNNRYDPQNDKGIYYLRTTVEVTVNDAARPSVTQIVNDAVDLCRQETNGSEYDMALWLHDWTLDQLEYDHGLNWCSAESGLTRHQGTCESYQRIYSKLLDAAGIANGRITGNGHTWNAVKIDGKWCQMDLTWDDTSDNWYGDLDQRHLYFGLSDELMAIAHSDHTANHQKDDYDYRSTDLSNNYFVRNCKAEK
jgi:transglutaminase/protease-like cytokinesis protein 3